MRWKQSIVGEAAAADTSLQRPKIDGGGGRERERSRRRRRRRRKRERRRRRRSIMGYNSTLCFSWLHFQIML